MIQPPDLLIQQNAVGIYHVANPKPYTHFKIGLEICREAKINNNLIRSIKINELNLLDKRPLDITLNSNKFIEEYHYEFIDLKESIKSILTSFYF